MGEGRQKIYIVKPGEFWLQVGEAATLPEEVWDKLKELVDAEKIEIRERYGRHVEDVGAIYEREHHLEGVNVTFVEPEEAEKDE